MRHFLMFLFVCVIAIAVSTQANSQVKGKDKSKTQSQGKSKGQNSKDANDRTIHEKKIWDGTYTKAADGPKPSKNQPAKVRAAFYRDYPNATGVYWSKYRGDWTASFRNGAWMSTAVYHANGDRRDTRTIISRNEMPAVILDDILKKKPDSRLDDVIKIEVPKAMKDIFRIKSMIDGKAEYLFYNADGLPVTYNY